MSGTYIGTRHAGGGPGPGATRKQEKRRGRFWPLLRPSRSKDDAAFLKTWGSRPEGKW